MQSVSVTERDETRSITAGDLVFSPADTPHSIGAGDERMVMFFVKGPGQAEARERSQRDG